MLHAYHMCACLLVREKGGERDEELSTIVCTTVLVWGVLACATFFFVGLGLKGLRETTWGSLF